jgi:acetoin utilization deacetylase AcuC-like enzyme
MLPLVVHHPAYSYTLPAGHRFPMAKFRALLERLRADRLLEAGQEHVALPAERAWLELAHRSDYVSAILELTLGPAEQRRLGLPLSPALTARSLAAVGGTVHAARLALEHGVACNLAGGSHHAFAEGGAGFCVFNDVAVAALLLLGQGQVRRIAVIDLDVHQGDGTAAILANEPRVFTLSMHCRANFPVLKQQSDLDIALDAGTGDPLYLPALRAVLGDVLDRVRPDLVFYNAGVDPHEADQLGRLALTDQGLAEREALVLETCRARGLPVTCVLGGGYGPMVEDVVGRHAILHRVLRDLPAW